MNKEQAIKDVCLIARNAIERIGELEGAKQIMSATEESELRERLRETEKHLSVHQRLAAALMEPKPWVGLTDEEMETLYYGNADTITGTEIKFGRAIEAKLKEKNSG